MFDSFATFLVNAALRQPLLVVIDDLHLADAASIELLRFLLPPLGTTRTAVLATYRDPHADPHSALPAQLMPAEAPATSLALRGLSRDEVGRLLTRLSGAPAGAGPVAWTYERTAGNPYFVTELHNLLEARAAGAPPDPLTPPAAWLPHSIRDALRSHLARATGRRRRRARAGRRGGGGG